MDIWAWIYDCLEFYPKIVNWSDSPHFPGASQPWPAPGLKSSLKSLEYSANKFPHTLSFSSMEYLGSNHPKPGPIEFTPFSLSSSKASVVPSSSPNEGENVHGEGNLWMKKFQWPSFHNKADRPVKYCPKNPGKGSSSSLEGDPNILWSGLWRPSLIYEFLNEQDLFKEGKKPWDMEKKKNQTNFRWWL